ncbi:MAG: nucleotidyltransferase domain-containing protein [Spirochaetales bacterium]|nr:nucleotidyltransferase domain-containing protein [Spirochaetales bacterium]
MLKDSRILAVYLLGSFASGKMREDSDIDLALMLEPGKKITELEKIKMISELSFTLKRSVDLGEISSKNLVYSREAFFFGKLLCKKSLDRVNLMRANLLGMYDNYNFDRQELLNAYRN